MIPLPHLVLVVEDEAVLRMLAVETLKDSGFEVLEARHGDEALRVLREHGPEVSALFTDIHMPGSPDGLDLAHLTFRDWPDIHLVVASGLATPGTTDMPAGCRFFQKPYQLAHIVRHLHSVTQGT